MFEENKKYELIIIGAGPAGLAASIYAARYGVAHVVLGALLGGQTAQTHLVDNYPGTEDISGLELAQKMAAHAKKYGTEILAETVVSVEKVGSEFAVHLSGERKLRAKALLLATGTKKRKMGIASEEKFAGRGVSYCATCDGFFYKGKTIAVIGGNDSAVGAAVYLSKIAKKVFLIYRGSQLRAETYWQKLATEAQVETIFNTNILAITGEQKVEKIQLDQAYNGSAELVVDGLFVEIGSEPDLNFAEKLQLAKDSEGYIQVQKTGATSVVGVWAAGDTTDGSDKFRQIITAAAEGAIAAKNISRFLQGAGK